MSRDASVRTDLVVRSYRDDDEAEVLELLRGSLGGGPAGERTPAYFRWKHLENPFGRSYMIVAEHEARIIGFRALMRWRFRVGDRTIEAVRPVDTVTHPDHRGRGVFSTLTRTALDSLRGEVDVVFNTPNPDSLRGYLKMGWQVVGEVPISIQIRRPGRFVAGRLRRSLPERPRVAAPTAAEVLQDDQRLAQLLDGSEVSAWGYSTARTGDHLRWRYADAPLLGYHAVREEREGELIGLAFFRLRPEGSLWGFSIADVIVRPGDVGTARRLLAAAARTGDVAYVATSFPTGTTAERASRTLLTVPSPRKPTFVVNPLRSDLHPDPRLLSSWALSASDVEVF
jgi:GNAT superfamily N-acetyltransferase